MFGLPFLLLSSFSRSPSAVAFSALFFRFFTVERLGGVVMAMGTRFGELFFCEGKFFSEEGFFAFVLVVFVN